MKSSMHKSSLPSSWKFSSPRSPGFHTVVSSDNSACREVRIFRLNLRKNASYVLYDELLEMNVAVIAGHARLKVGRATLDMAKLDSFYLPAGIKAKIEAVNNLVVYAGGGIYEGIGRFHFRKFDLGLPVGAIHQIHGRPPYRREVFMTVNPELPASRLIAGFTWGDTGGWTSWPPHQHEKDLEEVYCYFDMPAPQMAMHLSYTEEMRRSDVHFVSSGDFVIAPCGYHPTIAVPGARSTYFWVLAARSHASRRYDLALSDPCYGSAHEQR